MLWIEASAGVGTEDSCPHEHTRTPLVYSASSQFTPLMQTSLAGSFTSLLRNSPAGKFPFQGPPEQSCLPPFSAGVHALQAFPALPSLPAVLDDLRGQRSSQEHQHALGTEQSAAGPERHRKPRACVFFKRRLFQGNLPREPAQVMRGAPPRRRQSQPGPEQALARWPCVLPRSSSSASSGAGSGFQQ